ncbi:MAG: hypothetical protein AMXMBFR23_16560 [Chloroflexota bacterium]
MIVEIECLPTPPGTPEQPYKHVEAAIAAIERSGLAYEVDALGTTFEGDPALCWEVARRVHEACLEAGARSVVTVAKFAQHADPATQPTIASLTGKFRG